MDVLAVIDKLEIEVESLNKSWANCLCPFHDDHFPSLGINIESGAVICFAGCISGDLVDLVKKMIHGNTFDALKWINDGSELMTDFNKPYKNLKEEWYKIYSISDIEKQGFTLNYCNTYLISRRFDSVTIKSWKIYSSPAKICIPAIDSDGDIVGLIYRNLLKEKPKYLYSDLFPKSNLLFGINHCKKSIPYLILVEGAFDCIWLWQNGYIALAVLGSHLSRKQFEDAIHLTNTIYLCGDNDTAGRIFNKDISNKLKEVEIRTKIIEFQGFKDVQEMDSKVLKKVMEENNIEMMQYY